MQLPSFQTTDHFIWKSCLFRWKKIHVQELLTSSLITVALLKERSALVIFLPKSANTILPYWVLKLKFKIFPLVISVSKRQSTVRHQLNWCFCVYLNSWKRLKKLDLQVQVVSKVLCSDSQLSSTFLYLFIINWLLTKLNPGLMRHWT